MISVLSWPLLHGLKSQCERYTKNNEGLDQQEKTPKLPRTLKKKRNEALWIKNRGMYTPLDSTVKMGNPSLSLG